MRYFNAVHIRAPTLIAETGSLSLGTSALIFTIPSILAIPISLLFSSHSDRNKEEIRHATFGQSFVLLGVICTALIEILTNQGPVNPNMNTLIPKPVAVVLLVLSLLINQAGQNMFYNTFLGFQANRIFAEYDSAEVTSVGFAIVNIGAACGNVLGPFVTGAVANSFGFGVSFFVAAAFSVAAILFLIILIILENKAQSKRDRIGKILDMDTNDVELT